MVYCSNRPTNDGTTEHQVNATHTHVPTDRRKYAELFIRHAQLFLYPWIELSHRVSYFMRN